MGSDYHTSLGTTTFIVKLAADGTFVWGRTLDPRSDDGTSNIVAIFAAADGSIDAGGQFMGHIDFDPGTDSAERSGTNWTSFVWKLNGDGSFSWVDVWDVALTPSCQIIPGQFAVSAAGTVWSTGSYSGTCDFDPGSTIDFKPGAPYSDGFLSAVDAAGKYLGAWTFAARELNAGSSATNVLVDDQGAVYAIGTFGGGAVDFDPGAAEAVRSSPSGSSFVVKLNAAGVFQWVTTQAGLFPGAVALGPGGTLLAAGNINDSTGTIGLAELLSDGSLGWTLELGTNYNNVVPRVVATPKGFFLGGISTYQGADADPGPGVDNVPGGSVYVSEFAY